MAHQVSDGGGVSRIGLSRALGAPIAPGAPGWDVEDLVAGRAEGQAERPAVVGLLPYVVSV